MFLYGILTAIFLPFPVEVALLIRPEELADPLGILIIAIVIGFSKMIGAGLVFLLGLRIEGPIRYYSARYPPVGRGVGYVTRFVRVTGSVGLFILLAIPFLPDTLPIYLYSLFNKQGQLIRGSVFLLVNFLAGIVRALIFLTLATFFGISFVL